MKQFLSALFLKYLRFLAKIQLLKNNPTIIGITGTAGKTSTRNAVAAVLKDSFKIKVSYKANSETGIPLNILGLKAKDYSWQDWMRIFFLAPIRLLTNWERYQIYVVEMAIDSPFPPKNMGYLLTIVKPDIGILLNAKPMHSLGFDQLVKEEEPEERSKKITKLIAQEKGRMITQLPQSGAAILNFDDINAAQFKDETRAEVIGFGQSNQAKLKFSDYQVSLQGSEFEFTYQNQSKKINFDHYLLPKHFGYTFAAAISIGLKLKLEISQCLTALEKNFNLPPGRSSLIPAINQAWILDSSYNASAQPTIDSLELINRVAPGRKIALLGDIRELGQETKPEHELVAHKAAQICDLVLLVGPQTRKYIYPILNKKGVAVKHCQNAYQAAKLLGKQLEKDDLVLVKGSQNTLLLEIAVKQLMRDKNQADQLLCRRGNYWDLRRAELLEKS